MKTVLQLAGAAALLAVATFFGVLAHVTSQIPRKLDAIQADVNTHAAAIRVEALHQIEEARRDAFTRSDQQISALRTEIIPRVDTLVSLADSRMGEGLQAVYSVTALANAQINGIRADIQPVLANSAAAIKDGQDSWDDLYWDVKASVGSATVAARGIAEASEAVGKAAPAMTQASTETAQQISGITGDIHTVTTRFTAPQTRWQKVWGGIKTGIFVGARALF